MILGQRDKRLTPVKPENSLFTSPAVQAPPAINLHCVINEMGLIQKRIVPVKSAKTFRNGLNCRYQPK